MAHQPTSSPGTFRRPFLKLAASAALATTLAAASVTRNSHLSSKD